MTWAEYAETLEANLVDLHARVHTGAYRALPSRRRYIPKADGRQRPLGIAIRASYCTLLSSASGR
jgi:RNA-directed DNA polymerase